MLTPSARTQTGLHHDSVQIGTNMPTGLPLRRTGARCAAHGSGRHHVASANARIGVRRRDTRRAAAVSLTEYELQELVAENAKLRQLLVAYVDRLSPEQVTELTQQYEEIQALAASAGLDLEPLPPRDEEQPSKPPAAAAAAPQPAAPAAAPAAPVLNGNGNGNGNGGGYANGNGNGQVSNGSNGSVAQNGHQMGVSMSKDTGGTVSFSFDNSSSRPKVPPPGSAAAVAAAAMAKLAANGKAPPAGRPVNGAVNGAVRPPMPVAPMNGASAAVNGAVAKLPAPPAPAAASPPAAPAVPAAPKPAAAASSGAVAPPPPAAAPPRPVGPPANGAAPGLNGAKAAPPPPGAVKAAGAAPPGVRPAGPPGRPPPPGAVGPNGKPLPPGARVLPPGMKPPPGARPPPPGMRPPTMGPPGARAAGPRPPPPGAKPPPPGARPPPPGMKPPPGAAAAGQRPPPPGAAVRPPPPGAPPAAAGQQRPPPPPQAAAAAAAGPKQGPPSPAAAAAAPAPPPAAAAAAAVPAPPPPTPEPAAAPPAAAAPAVLPPKPQPPQQSQKPTAAALAAAVAARAAAAKAAQQQAAPAAAAPRAPPAMPAAAPPAAAASNGAAAPAAPPAAAAAGNRPSAAAALAARLAAAAAASQEALASLSSYESDDEDDEEDMYSSSSSIGGSSSSAQRMVSDPDLLDDPEEEEEAVIDVEVVPAKPKYIPPTPEEKAEREAKFKLIREEAQGVVDTHNPAVLARNRHSWMIFTVPEKPVAGADVVVYFNKAQSETLKDRNRLQMILGYNGWEVQADRRDLGSSPIPHVDGSDYWWVRYRIPEDVFEMNFVFTDGEGLYDNNGGQDFMYKTECGISFEEWQHLAEEREKAAEAERKEEERRRQEEAQKSIEEQMRGQDIEAAKKRVVELRDNYVRLKEGAVLSRKLENGNPYWSVAPQPLYGGTTATILYNSKAGPLTFLEGPPPKVDRATIEAMKKPKFVVGFNSFQVKVEPFDMQPCLALENPPGEVWWEASVKVPENAINVSFCVTCDNVWDNNGGKDHKVAVSLPKGVEDVVAWAESFLPLYEEQERTARRAREEEARRKEEARMAKRMAAQAKCKTVLRRQQRHILFTEPEVLVAGKKAKVFYCPDNTCLAGKDKIYFTGGFNRWTHHKSIGPIEMDPPDANGQHWHTIVTIPKDAHLLDFVFSDVPSGPGTYDNRGSLDYHMPVEGAFGPKPPPLHVVHISVEMAPIAKVGGLGDVVTALGRAVQEEGHKVEVILPRHEFFLHSHVLSGRMAYETEFDWGGTRIYVTTAEVEGLRCFFIEPKNKMFDKPTVYGYYEDEVRFDFFCKAALEFLLKTGRQPDILHCHDWSTAHVAPAFWNDYQPYGLWKPKVVFTIHNLNYGQKRIAEAATFCQKFTTVSPTYAMETGGHPIIAPHVSKFMGIRNGIDWEIWSPEENPYLPLCYNHETCDAGKQRAREALRGNMHLSGWGDKPIVAVVSRLTPQKGVHLIKHAAYRAIERGAQFVLLGTAPDPKLQAEFDDLAAEVGGHGGSAGFRFTYDEPLSHLIYAAADILLVPSNFEPCGLTQMIAMRYGAVPVVRHTGGLKDTVFDVDNDKARAAWEVYGSNNWMADRLDATNGFAFEGMDTDGLDYALNRALDAFYNDKPWFRSLQRRIMQQDWSWNRPAIDYVELYYSAIRS